MKCSGSPDDYLPSYFQTFYQARTWTQPAFYLAFWYYILFKGLKSFVFTPAMYVHFNLQLIHLLLDWNTWCILSICDGHVNKFYLRSFQAVRHLWYTLSLELVAFVWVIWLVFLSNSDSWSGLVQWAKNNESQWDSPQTAGMKSYEQKDKHNSVVWTDCSSVFHMPLTLIVHRLSMISWTDGSGHSEFTM